MIGYFFTFLFSLHMSWMEDIVKGGIGLFLIVGFSFWFYKHKIDPWFKRRRDQKDREAKV